MRHLCPIGLAPYKSSTTLNRFNAFSEHLRPICGIQCLGASAILQEMAGKKGKKAEAGQKGKKVEPTKAALLSDSDSDEPEGVSDEEEVQKDDESFFWDKEDEDDEDENEFEKKAKALDKAKAQEEKDAEDELQTNIAAKEKFVLPSGQEIEKEKIQPPDLALVRQRIDDIISVLAKFRENR